MKFITSATLIFAFFSTMYSQTAKFLPTNNRVLLIVGQDLGAVGGFVEPNNNGYFDHLKHVPGGVTTYSCLPYLNGLKYLDNYGSGDVFAQAIIDNPTYKNSVLAIGLSLKGEITNIADGVHDNAIIELGNWVKSTNRPVFIRIGYEFDGGWNNYNPPGDYILSFRRIVDVFKDIGVENFATVWQSSGYEGSDPTHILSWYPGDEYVDWLGYSHFHNNSNGAAMMALSKTKNKPIMIAESTPKGYKISDPNTPVWNDWFKPFFSHIHNSDHRIRAVAYINNNWDVQPMWAGQGWGDTRVEMNETVKSQWLLEVSKNIWLNGSDSLFKQLGFEVSISQRKSVTSTKKSILKRTKEPMVYSVHCPNASLHSASVISVSGQKRGCFINGKTLTVPILSSGIYIVNLTSKTGKIFNEKIVISQ